MRWFLLPSEAQLQLMGQPITRVTPPFQPRNFQPVREVVREERVGHCPGEVGGDQQSQGAERPKTRSVAVDVESGSRIKKEEDVIEAEVFVGSREDRSFLARSRPASHGVATAAAHNGDLGPSNVIGTSSAAVEASDVNTDAGGPEVQSIETEQQQTSVPLTVGKARLTQLPAFHCPPKRLMKPTIEASS